MSTLSIATYNMRARATRNNKKGVLDDLEVLLDHAHVISLQEGGDAFDILQAAKALGADFYRGDGRYGAAATPILYRNTLNIRNTTTVPISPTVILGERGAGPSRQKAKFVNSVTFRFDNRRITVGSIHVVSSIYIPRRKRLARSQINKAANYFTTEPGLRFLAGDFNMLPDNSLLSPLRTMGMSSSQMELGWKPTHGRRTIDDIWFLDDERRISPASHMTIRGVSDHKALVVNYDVIPRVDVPAPVV